MIHGGKEREVVLVLDYPEGEAAPLQRIRYGHDVSVYFVNRHVAVIDRREFNISRISDGMPDERVIIGVLEPTSERVMPTQVCVKGLIHGRNITRAGHFTATDNLPGKFQPGGCPFPVITKMLALHVAQRHRTDRRLPGLFLSGGRGVPGGD